MISQLLATIPMFSHLDPEHRDELARGLQQQQVAASQPVFWVGDSGTNLYLISEGKVALSAPDESGQDIHLAELGPGQFFGELSLLDGGRRTATARAVTDTRLLSLERDAFHQFVMKHPTASIHIISELGRRQRDMVHKLRGVVNVNQVLSEKMTPWTRIADTIAAISASQGFVLAHVAFVVFWVTFNAVRGEKGFDPFPFLFLGMFASLEAIFLSIFVLISQNRQSEKDRIRADLDYQVNVKAHVEVMQLHQKIDELRKIIEAK